MLLLMPSIEASAAASPFVLIIQLLFSGVFINYDKIPGYLWPFEYTSMFKYAWSAAMQNELQDWDVVDCMANNYGTTLCDPLSFYNIKRD